MGISIDVELPGFKKHFVDICRVEGSTAEDSINRYEAVLFEENTDSELSVFFTHRYGDGWIKCVELALRTLRLVQETEEE